MSGTSSGTRVVFTRVPMKVRHWSAHSDAPAVAAAAGSCRRRRDAESPSGSAPAPWIGSIYSPTTVNGNVKVKAKQHVWNISFGVVLLLLLLLCVCVCVCVHRVCTHHLCRSARLAVDCVCTSLVKCVRLAMLQKFSRVCVCVCVCTSRCPALH